MRDVVSADEMPLGMKKVPLGWPLMSGAFIDFAHFAISKKCFVEAFQEDTESSLDSLMPQSPIDHMIDDATGHTRSVMSEFLDWLVVYHWGEELLPIEQRGES